MDLYLPSLTRGRAPVIIWSAGSAWLGDNGNQGGELLAQRFAPARVRRGRRGGPFQLPGHLPEGGLGPGGWSSRVQAVIDLYGPLAAVAGCEPSLVRRSPGTRWYAICPGAGRPGPPGRLTAQRSISEGDTRLDDRQRCVVIPAQ
jgi:hypothetical protein